MRITRMRALVALAAVLALALATGGALAVGKNARIAAAAAADEVIYACRHPNGGCVRACRARPIPGGRGQAGTVEAMRMAGRRAYRPCGSPERRASGVLALFWRRRVA